MTTYVDMTLGDLFTPQGGKAKYIRDYMDAHPGVHPVYSASLTKPFGYVDAFDYDGHYLTWVMNGYGGRVREVEGKFSVNRDRGVLLPKEGMPAPDLTYMRFALEPQMTAAAVGRRVDGRLNEYTKIYRDDAAEIVVRLPVTDSGALDYDHMKAAGQRLRAIELAQARVQAATLPLQRAVFPVNVSSPSDTVSLADDTVFTLSIGERVLTKDHADLGIPVYSANALVPFGHVLKSNLSDFARPSLLWGIDGNFDWNYVPEGVEFATTDHCGRLQVLSDKLDPFYVYCYLKATRATHGFDRVFRASLRNVRANVEVVVPLGDDDEPSLDRQKALAADYEARVRARTDAISALAGVTQARLTSEL